MRYVTSLLILLPAFAYAAPEPFSVEAAPMTPAGIGAVVRRSDTSVATECTAVLLDCRYAVVDRTCVAADTDPRSLQVFFPRLGRVDVEAVIAGSESHPDPGVVLLRLGEPAAGMVPLGALAKPAPEAAASLAGFGRATGKAASTGLGCAAGVVVESCAESPASDAPRVCWRRPGEAAKSDDACQPDEDGVLLAGGGPVGVSRVGEGDAMTGGHRPLAADNAFLEEVRGDVSKEPVCGLRARVTGPAARVTGLRGQLDSAALQAEGELEVAEGMAELVVTLQGVDGSDFDLFVKHGSPATIASFDCDARGPGSYHECRIVNPAAGRWFVLISRVSGKGRFQATASVFAPPCADPIHDGRACDDGNVCTSDDRCFEKKCVGTAVPGPAPCDDGDRCTTPDRCVEGRCAGTSSCGDGTVQSTCEECDDGNTVAGDGCEPDCRVSRTGAFVGYVIRPARTPENRLPRNWTLRLDDVRLRDAADDPENFTVDAPMQLLLPAAAGEQVAPDAPGRALLRYRLSEGREGVGDPEDGRFPRVERHVSRQWRVATEEGEIVVESKDVSALLVPARIGADAVPEAGGNGDAYKCYVVRVARGVDSALAPEGRFERGLQQFLADGFADCQREPGGSVFAGTRVAGKCLYDLQKPVELCNPVAVEAVAAPRSTAVPPGAEVETRPDSTASLLCMQAQRAARVRAERAAAALGVRIGEAITPRQPAHRKRLEAQGEPVRVRPENGFPAPTLVDTMRPATVCLPALATVEP